MPERRKTVSFWEKYNAQCGTAFPVLLALILVAAKESRGAKTSPIKKLFTVKV
jgi:hypothetical protein